jgi:uncharacterized protein YjiS (DUF1127 family)
MMNIWLDAISLAAGVPVATDHRPARTTPNPAPRTRRAAAAGRLARRILADIGGAVPLHAFEGLRRWRRRSRAIKELGALNNRLLRDIGVDRSNIRETVDAVLRAETGGRTW